MLRIVKGILLGTVITTTSFATNSSNTILFVKGHLPKITIPDSVTKSPIIKGSDFSGHWSGTCKNLDGTSQLEIEQLEDSITINGQDFKFGAMTIIASSDTDSYGNSQMRFTWNPKRTVLTLNGTSINTGNNEKNIYTSISETSMTLSNDQLVMKIQAKFYNNLNPMDDTFDENCIFTKVQ